MNDTIEINGLLFSVAEILEKCSGYQPDFYISSGTEFKAKGYPDWTYVATFFFLGKESYYLFVRADKPTERWCEPVPERTTWKEFLDQVRSDGYNPADIILESRGKGTVL